MKPAPFDYRRVHDIEEALAHLSELGDEAKVLAGGQSLVPLMNFRLVRPTTLVDINRVQDLDTITREGDLLAIGTLVRHATIERAGRELEGYRILPDAARWIGHGPIRTRGTFGGSLAHADPTAEWCMLALALDAQIVCRSAERTRTVSAQDFLIGFMTTTLQPDELITEVRFPRPWPRASIQEFARRRGDFAVVAVAAALDLSDGRCRQARIVIGGVEDIPIRSREAEAVLADAEPGTAAFAQAGATAAETIDPVGDIHGSAAYRRRLTKVLVERALHEAAAHG